MSNCRDFLEELTSMKFLLSEIREDISTLPWVMVGDMLGEKSPQDQKGVENLLADWFVQVHNPKDYVDPRRWSQFNENWAMNTINSIIWDFWEKD